jgi:HPt (histidine-containing phosphotransfer) domain-containing protein
MMLEKFEGLSLSLEMKRIAEAIDENDFLKMNQAAHKLTSASGYVGASIMHYVCVRMQKAFGNKNF